jgi:lipid A ethanolaminephosphotransferase
VLTLGTAFASHFMDRFGVYLDPSMLRNVLRTDAKEAAHARPPVSHRAGSGGRAYGTA